MKTSNAQKIKAGIFTIAGILIFAAGIFFIGIRQNMFGGTYLIYGTFSNVSGLEPGNNIRFAGINVGTVEAISIVSDTLIRVDMRMKTSVKPFLKADALAAIGSDGLMGDKLVTITSGSANEVQLLSGGSRIMTVNPVDLDRILGQFTAVAGDAEVIMHELAGMAVQIREGHGTISKLLYTDDLSISLERTAANAERITHSLKHIMGQIQSGRGSIGSLVYTDSLSNALESAGVTANAAMRTIQEGAEGFSENMKALQGNYFLRGYFKRKARDGDGETEMPGASEEIDADMDEKELEDIIKEAQKALDAKRKATRK